MFNDVFKIKDPKCRTLAFEILYLIKRKEGDFKNFPTSLFGLFEHSSLEPWEIKIVFDKLHMGKVFTFDNSILKFNEFHDWEIESEDLDEQKLLVLRQYYYAKRPIIIERQLDEK